MPSRTLSKTNSAFVIHSQKPYSKYVLEAIVDFSSTATTGLTTQNDVMEAIAIPANCRVNHVRCEVLTVEGAARNYAVGDGATPTGFIPSTTANTLGSTHNVLAGTLGGTGAAADPVVITGYTSGKFYAVADTIDILAVSVSGLTACKLKLSVDVTDYN